MNRYLSRRNTTLSTGLVTAVIAVVLLALGHAAAHAAGPLTPEMVVGMSTVGAVAMSPDGTSVVFTLNTPRDEDEEHGPAHSELRIVTASGGGQPRALTHPPGRASSPAFSPDGRSLAFVAKRGDDEHAQVYVLSMSGGEARRVTAADQGVASFAWSPDGSSLAYVSVDSPSEEEEEADEAGRDWTVVGVDQKTRRLWRIPAAGGTATEVSTDAVSVWHFAWFPDGRRLVATASDRPDTDSSYIHKRLVTYPAGGGKSRILWRAPGKIGAPRVSPDGRHVAVNAAVVRSHGAAGHVFVIDADSGAAIDRTPALPATATAVHWRSAEELVFTAQHGTSSLLAVMAPDAGNWRQALGGSPVFTQASLSADGEHAAFVASTPGHPPEVYAGPFGSTPLRLTTHNPEVESADLGRQEVIRWTAEDGLEVEGVLIHPAGSGESGGSRPQYPLVSVVHGGPESCWLNGWNTSYGRWGQVLAGRGFMVLMANYRGSTGRGAAYAMADHRDLAGREFRDVLDGIDSLVQQGLVDPTRVGSGGGSYGGYFSAWAATRHADRFAASVVFAGIANWISFTGSSDIPEENSIVHWDLDPYSRSDLAWDRSPVAHLDVGRTPVLIAHGEKDLRVPLSQGTELYTALRLRGRPVEYVTYPREPHGLRERAHQLDYMKRSIDWFERWLKGRRD